LGRRPTFIDGGRHTWNGSFTGSSSWIHGSGTSLVKGSWSCHRPAAGAEGVGVRREDAERSRLPPPRVAPPRVGVERTPLPVDGAVIAAIGDEGERHGSGSRRGRCLPPPPSMGLGWGSRSWYLRLMWEAILATGFGGIGGRGRRRTFVVVRHPRPGAPAAGGE